MSLGRRVQIAFGRFDVREWRLRDDLVHVADQLATVTEPLLESVQAMLPTLDVGVRTQAMFQEEEFTLRL